MRLQSDRIRDILGGMNTDDPTQALADAITAKGSQQALASAIGRRQSTVWTWLNRDGKCAADAALDIERVTGVSRHRLRADVFGPPPDPDYRPALARLSA